MSNILKYLSLALLVASTNLLAVEKKGVAAYGYADIGSYMLNKDIIRSNAKKQACNDAYKKFTTSFNNVKKSNYQRVQRQIEDNLDMYMTCTQVLDEENDSSNSIYNIVVKANIDANKIDEVIMGSSAIATEGAVSDIAILMIVRTASSVLKRDDKRVDVFRDTDSTTRTTSTDNRNTSAADSRSSESSQYDRRNDKTVDTDQTEAVGDTGASISSRTATGDSGSYDANSQSMSDSQNENTSDTSRTNTTVRSGKKETGGNTLIRADKITYELSDEYQDAMEANLDTPLSAGGFELISMGDFSDKLLDAHEEMRVQYASTSKMNRKLEKVIRNELAASEIKLNLPEDETRNQEYVVKEIAGTANRKANEQEPDSNTKEAFQKLLLWFRENPDDAKRLFPDLYKRKHILYDEEVIVDNMEKAEQLNDLLTEYDVVSPTQLKALIEKGQSENSLLPITEDILASMGITSIDKWNEAIKDKDLAALFSHDSVPDTDLFVYVHTLINKAKQAVIDHLETLEEYDVSDCEEIAPTTLAGIKKEGQEIYVVVRPAHKGQVIIYYGSEQNTLDYEQAELWVDDGSSEPKRITLGHILKKANIRKFPI